MATQRKLPLRSKKKAITVRKGAGPAKKKQAASKGKVYVRAHVRGKPKG